MMMTTQLGRSILASVASGVAADSMLARPDEAGGYGDIDEIILATAARLGGDSTPGTAAGSMEEAVGGMAPDKAS